MPGSETKHYDFGNSFIYDVAFRHKDKEFLPHKINIVDLNRMAKCGNIVLEELAVLFFAKNKDEIDGIKTELALKWRKRLMELNNDFLTKYAEFVKESHEQDEIAQRKYDDEQLIAEGLAEGKVEKAIDIARNMLAEGFEYSTISRCTGLSIEEIEELIK